MVRLQTPISPREPLQLSETGRSTSSHREMGVFANTRTVRQSPNLLGAPKVTSQQAFHVRKPDIESLSETDIIIPMAEMPSVRDYDWLSTG